MRVFNRHVSTRGLTVFGFETVLIAGSILVAALVHGSADASGVIWKVLLATAVCELCFYYNDLYDLNLVQRKTELIVRVLQAAGAAAIVLAIASVVVPSLMMGHGTFITSLFLMLVAVPLWRIAFEGLSHDPALDERVLIVGTGTTARMLAQQIGTQRDFAYRLVGFVDDGTGHTSVRAHDVLGGAADITRIVAERHIDRIVVGLSDRRGHLPIE